MATGIWQMSSHQFQVGSCLSSFIKRQPRPLLISLCRSLCDLIHRFSDGEGQFILWRELHPVAQAR